MNNSSEERRPLLTALLGVSLWTAVEIIARRVLASRVGKFTDDDLARDMLVTLATIPLLGWVIGRIGNRMGFKQKTLVLRVDASGYWQWHRYRCCWVGLARYNDANRPVSVW